jgi:hypothetical protein
MNKHKYKKRRKKQKFLRRRLGKWILAINLCIVIKLTYVLIYGWNSLQKMVHYRAEDSTPFARSVGNGRQSSPAHA